MKRFLLSILCCLLAVVSGFAEEVTYTVTSTSAVSVSSGAPAGSSATYSSTYSDKFQLTGGHSMTLTLKGFAGNKITGIKLSMKSNKSAGAGNFSATVGGTTISSISTANFNSANWADNYSQSYVDVTPAVTATEVGTGENVVLKIAATVNSLYCQSFTITYEPIGGGDTGGEEPETPVDPDAPTENYKVVASELGKPNASEFTSLEFGAVTATFDKGTNSNATKYYTTGAALRAYGGNTITFTGAGGITITEIKFTFGTDDGSNAILVDSGTFSENTWTGASNKVVFTIGGSTGHRRIAAIEVTYSINENIVVIVTPSITTSTSFVGSTTVEITNNEADTELYYSTNGEDYDIYTGALIITETTTVYAYSQDANGNKSEVAVATFTKIGIVDGDVIDILTRESTGVSGTSYKDWTYNSNQSKVVYAGNSAGGNNAIQLRSNNSNSGIVTTASSGKVKKIIVEWEESTDEARELEIYGRTTAYSAATDLYASGTQGTKLGSIDRSSTEFTINGNYEYIGLRSKSGAMYLTSIFIIWETSYTLQVTGAGWATLYLDKNVTIPSDVNCYVITEVANGSATLTEVTGVVLPANTGVIVEAVPGDYTFAITDESANIEKGLMKGTTADEPIDEEAYVLSIVDGEVGLYKAQMAGGVFLNNANKAYLPASALTASAQGASGFKFRFDNQTTGIEGAPALNTAKAIYDLSGRKVNDITAPGLYIVNGKKVMVK